MKLFTTAKVLACCLLLSVAFTSCQSGQTTSGKADSTSASSVDQNGGANNLIPTIYLDSLTVPAKTFVENKNKNFVFEYFLGDSAVTLNGWITEKGKTDSIYYSLTPNVKLLPKGKTNVSLGPNTYVSNQLLTKETVKKIVAKINADKSGRVANLIFKPMRNTVTNRIFYQIAIEFINKTNPELGSEFYADPDFNTNPSPPHGFN